MNAQQSLFLVRAVHTAIWAFFAGLIFYILIAGITGAITPAVYVSIALVAVESLVLIFFGWRCPLTIIAFRYTEDRASNFDIFLPAWLAEHNKTIFGFLYAAGLALVLYRAFS